MLNNTPDILVVKDLMKMFQIRKQSIEIVKKDKSPDTVFFDNRWSIF